MAVTETVPGETGLGETVRIEMAAALSEAPGGEERRSERAARLLEAGEYPDKKLRLTEADLDAIAARFAAEVGAGGGEIPVKVEHLDSPLDPLGHVVRVWREGTALLGMLAFPDDMAGFLRRRGAAKLSVGLAREPLALREVSLVLKPRVASAALLSAEVRSGEPTPQEPTPQEPTPPRSSAPLPVKEGKEKEGEGAGKEGVEMAAARGEIGRLRAELAAREAAGAAREVEAHLAAFKAQGRIVPASEGPARALLSALGEATVSLSAGPEPVGQVFRRFLEAQPPVVTFGESAAESAGTDGFTQSEHTFLSRLGVDPARVAALLAEEKKDGRKDGTQGQKGEGHAL